jgi:hypothetical protein
MLCWDNALLKEIGELLNHELKDLVLDWIHNLKTRQGHGRKNAQRLTSSLKQLSLS